MLLQTKCHVNGFRSSAPNKWKYDLWHTRYFYFRTWLMMQKIFFFFCKDIRQRKKCSINLRLVRGSREICGEQSLYRRGREKTITERNSSFVYSNWQTGYRLLSVAVSSLFRNEIDPENNPEHEQSAAFLRDSLVKVRRTERREPAQHGTTVRQIKLWLVGTPDDFFVWIPTGLIFCCCILYVWLSAKRPELWNQIFVQKGSVQLPR